MIRARPRQHTLMQNMPLLNKFITADSNRGQKNSTDAILGIGRCLHVTAMQRTLAEALAALVYYEASTTPICQCNHHLSARRLQQPRSEGEYQFLCLKK